MPRAPTLLALCCLALGAGVTLALLAAAAGHAAAPSSSDAFSQQQQPSKDGAQVHRFGNEPCGNRPGAPPGMHTLGADSCYMDLGHELTYGDRCRASNAVLRGGIVKSIKQHDDGRYCAITFTSDISKLRTADLDAYLARVRENMPSVLRAKDDLARMRRDLVNANGTLVALRDQDRQVQQNLRTAEAELARQTDIVAGLRSQLAS